jgi:hypothetical protein
MTLSRVLIDVFFFSRLCLCYHLVLLLSRDSRFVT